MVDFILYVGYTAYMMQTKTCGKCKIEQPVSEFSPSPKGLYGVHGTCKKCKRKYAAEKWKNDPEYRARVKKYDSTESRKEYARNHAKEIRKDPDVRESKRLYMVEYWEKHDGYEYHKSLIEKNPEYKNKLIEKRKDYNIKIMSDPIKKKERNDKLKIRRDTDKHREMKRNSYYKEKLKNNPQFFIVLNLRNRINKMMRGNLKTFHSKELLGCSLDYFVSYIESKWTNGMSWDNRGKSGWHFDHIIPCAYFDLTILENQKICFHHLNIQPLWCADNCSKQDQLPSNLEELLGQIKAAIAGG